MPSSQSILLLHVSHPSSFASALAKDLALPVTFAVCAIASETSSTVAVSLNKVVETFRSHPLSAQ